jgi:flagellar hook-length control protein FliK
MSASGASVIAMAPSPNASPPPGEGGGAPPGAPPEGPPFKSALEDRMARTAVAEGHQQSPQEGHRVEGRPSQGPGSREHRGKRRALTADGADPTATDAGALAAASATAEALVAQKPAGEPGKDVPPTATLDAAGARGQASSGLTPVPAGKQVASGLALAGAGPSADSTTSAGVVSSADPHAKAGDTQPGVPSGAADEATVSSALAPSVDTPAPSTGAQANSAGAPANNSAGAQAKDASAPAEGTDPQPQDSSAPGRPGSPLTSSSTTPGSVPGTTLAQAASTVITSTTAGVGTTSISSSRGPSPSPSKSPSVSPGTGAVSGADVSAPSAAAPAGVQAPAIASAAGGEVAYGVGLRQAIEAVHATIELASRQGLSQARIALSPADLGEIRIHLSQSAQGLVARVTADTPAAAQALAEGHAELRQSLHSLGLTALHMDTSAFDQASAQQQREGPANQAFAFTSGSSRSAAAREEADQDQGATSTNPEASVVTPGYPRGALVDVLA